MTTREKHWAKMTLIWIVYCLATLALLHLGPFWVIVFGMGSFLIALTCAFGRKILLLAILAGALLGTPVAQAWMPKNDRTNPKPNVTVIECAMGVVILVIGAVVIYKIWHFCDKHLPTAQNPPTPPQTNSTPVSFTNVYPALILGTFTNDAGWTCSDISGSPACAPYTVLASTTLSTSSNLANWQGVCTITQWWCKASMLTALYTNGQLANCSWTALAQGAAGMTNTVYVDSPRRQAAFFKME